MQTAQHGPQTVYPADHQAVIGLRQLFADIADIAKGQGGTLLPTIDFIVAPFEQSYGDYKIWANAELTEENGVLHVVNFGDNNHALIRSYSMGSGGGDVVRSTWRGRVKSLTDRLVHHIWRVGDCGRADRFRLDQIRNLVIRHFS